MYIPTVFKAMYGALISGLPWNFSFTIQSLTVLTR